MSYKTTITFPAQKINDVDTIQLILEFTHNLTGTDRNWNAVDYGLRVIDYGKREASYDLEDAFLVPGTTSMLLGDPQGVLDNLLFGADSIAVATDKKVKVTKKINGVSKFIGNMIEDTVPFDDGTATLSFTASPKIDVINKRMIYDAEGIVELNPLELTEANYYPLVHILEKIYQLVNPEIAFSNGSLEVIHNWQFQGEREIIGVGPDGCILNDISFTDLQTRTTPLFFDNSYGISNLGDVLRKISIDWCAFTGMISDNKAFFKRLFYYDENNLQTVKVENRIKNYKYGLIDYVKLNCVFNLDGLTFDDPANPYEQGVFTELEGRYLLRDSLQVFYHHPPPINERESLIAVSNLDRTNHYVFTHDGVIVNMPAEGAVYSNNGSQFQIIGTTLEGLTNNKLTTKRVSGTNDPSASGTLTKVSGTGDDTYTFTSHDDVDGFYFIRRARTPDLYNNEFKNYGDLASMFWYNFRGNMQHCRVDRFKLRGITYDFLKDFNYDGSKYQPISMIWNDAEGITECEAIYLGELA